MGGSKLAAVVVLGSALLLGLPLVFDTGTVFSLTVFAVMALLALSLGLVWGYGGILSLGQSAFFGVGAYAYAITALNVSSSAWGLCAAVVVPAALAAVIGYFAFYGRISDVYFAVISLTVSLILFNLVNSTSGQSWAIGDVRLGGYNGIPSVPPIQLPFADDALSFDGMYYLAGAVLLLAYLALAWLVDTPFGRVAVAVRESELRAELLGYDVRRVKLGMFCIGAGIAGVAGALFAAWGSFVGPDVFSVAFAAQSVIWVMFGGLGTLGGPIVGCIIVQALATWLGQTRLVDPNIVLGVIFIAAVLLLPAGIVPVLRRPYSRWSRRLRAREAA